MISESLWIQIGLDALSVVDRLLGSKRATKFKSELRRLLAAAQADPTIAGAVKRLLEGSPATGDWARGRLAEIKAEKARSSKHVVVRRRKRRGKTAHQGSFTGGVRLWATRSPVESEAGGYGETKKPFATVRVFYATDRKATGSEKPDSFYGAQRGELSLGTVEVSIPHDHRMGKIEGPAWWKLEFRKEPTKHVVLLSLEVLKRAEFLQSFRKCLCEKPTKAVLLFVHGYNVSFEDTCRRTAQIAYDLKFGGVVAAYSWPSEGQPKLYLVDETNVHWSVPHFRKFLSMLLGEAGAEAVHVIAHSMGNRALVEALRTFNTRDLPSCSARLNQVIFAAPDIDASTFREIAEEFRKKATRFTLYASSKDVALMASKAVHKYPRAGDCGGDLVLLDGLDTIDATKVDTALMGHSYIGNNDSILADVYDLLRDGSPPPKRFRLRRRERGGREYWMFQP